MNASITDQFVARVTFPLTSALMNRGRIMSRYQALLASEWDSPDALRARQLKRLQQVLAHAARRVPWYRRRFRELGLDPRDVRTLDDLRRIPPLTREDVIAHHREMVDERHAAAIESALASGRDAGAPLPLALFRRHRLVRNNSSGSTGAPTVFFEDGAITGLNWAFELRLKHWFGVPPGAREARLVRLSTSYVAGQRANRWRQRLWNQLILPGTNLRDADYEFSRQQLDAFRPRVLWGFTGALTGLADYLQRSGQRLAFRPDVAIGWAAPVYAHEQALLEEVLGCAVTNIYGSREVGHIALRCPAGAFHVNQEYLLAEVVPSPDLPDRDDAGEIVVTTLVPTPMPFIRYRMGDLGRLGPSRCDCGRQLEVLEEFVGRTGEVFVTRDGRMIPPNFWCRLFMAREIPGAIRRFQIVYTRDQRIVVKLVRGERFNEAAEQYLRRTLAENFGPATEFRLDYVDAIQPTTSGKYLMVAREP